MPTLPHPLPDAEAQCRALADLIRPQLHRNPALIGIHSGGAWVADQEVVVKGGKVVEYKVRLKLTFVLDKEGK